MNIVIPRAIFKAGVHCAANKEVRYYLVGVCLRLQEDKGQAFATDGSKLFACRFDVEGNDQSGMFELIIPIDAVKHASKGKTKSVDLVSLDDGSYLLDGFRFCAIAGKYPDVSRVIPNSNFEQKIGNYNPALLLDCDKALKAWHDNKGLTPQLYQNGSNAALMQTDNTAICVIMPLRLDSNDTAYGFTAMSVNQAKVA